MTGIGVRQYRPDKDRETWTVVVYDDQGIIVEIPCQTEAECARIAGGLKDLISRFP